MINFDFLNDIGNYAQRKVDNTILNNGMVIDTSYTSDCGYETAICNPKIKKWKILENNYPSKEIAKDKHKYWVKEMESKKWDDIKGMGFQELSEQDSTQE